MTGREEDEVLEQGGAYAWSSWDDQWVELMLEATERGEPRKDRTGVGTMALFGRMLEIDMAQGFPATTRKRLACAQVWAELACFLRGYSTLGEFHKMGCIIWDGNGHAAGWRASSWNRDPGDYLGRIYGVQWRRWRSTSPVAAGQPPMLVDQLAALRYGLRADPHSRRHVVTAWNPGEASDMCLPPCHMFFQAYVGEDEGGARRLDMAVYMRSVDLFLGLPFDVASYATLQHILGLEVDASPRRLVFFLGDAHVYNNHHEAVATVASRETRAYPRLALDGGTTLDTFEPSHARLDGYDPHPAVPARLNV